MNIVSTRLVNAIFREVVIFFLLCYVLWQGARVTCCLVTEVT